MEGGQNLKFHLSGRQDTRISACEILFEGADDLFDLFCCFEK